MLTIYLAGYNQGSYDDYQEVWLGAYPRKADAEAFIAVEDAKCKRLDAIYRVGWALFGERFDEARPLIGETPTVPQWSGKKGSKKLAPKEVVDEFNAQVAAANAERAKVYDKWKAEMETYSARRQACTHKCMLDAGATEEEIENGVIRTYDRSYEVKELPFFGTPQDLLKAVTHTLTSAE